jgi:hypothetical protein
VELVVTDAFLVVRVVRVVRGAAAEGAAVFLPVVERAAAGAADFVVELVVVRDASFAALATGEVADSAAGDFAVFFAADGAGVWAAALAGAFVGALVDRLVDGLVAAVFAVVAAAAPAGRFAGALAAGALAAGELAAGDFVAADLADAFEAAVLAAPAFVVEAFVVEAFAVEALAVEALAAGAFLAGAAAGADCLAPEVVARVTAALTDFTVDRTAEPTLEVVDRAGALSADDVVDLRAAVFLAASPRVVLPDAALLATIGPRPFVAHAVDVDKWGRQ